MRFIKLEFTRKEIARIVLKSRQAWAYGKQRYFYYDSYHLYFSRKK
jgi:hypothetical protein